MNDQKYISAADLTDGEIQRGIDSGELTPWRLDRQGQQWYARVDQHPPIRGVPADSVRGAAQ